MIKVTYDGEVDAKYVSIKEGKIHETKIVNDWLFFDVNQEGQVLGIEILDASKNQVTVSSLDDEVVHVGFSQNISNGEHFEQDFKVTSEYASAEAVLA